jgi:predicted pyridoxine 5'-phosphate oxidase superfamily flavin-nucleotide-binding protein
MTERVHDFHDGNRYFQDRFETRRLADRVAARTRDHIDAPAREVIERANMFFLATCDHRGLPTCSYKGGDPGFVRVLDASWVAFPNYDGNGKYQSMGNLRKNSHVGMLFVDFEQGRRLRLQGTATIDEADELLATYPEAQFIVRVHVTEVYNNCPRYIHKYQLVERSAYVPRSDRETPIPDWKRRDDLREVLPANDPARKRLSGAPEPMPPSR